MSNLHKLNIAPSTQHLLTQGGVVHALEGKLVSAIGQERPVIGGRCYNFNGIDNFINIPVEFSSITTTYLEFILYPTRNGQHQLGGGNAGSQLFFDTSNKRFYRANTFDLTVNELSVNKWLHIKIDFLLQTLEVNGTVYNIGTGGYLGGNQLFRRSDNTTNMFQGLVKYVKVSGENTLEFSFEEGAGLTAFDSSGNGNHGTINLGTSTEEAFHYKGYDVPYSDADSGGWNGNKLYKPIEEGINNKPLIGGYYTFYIKVKYVAHAAWQYILDHNSTTYSRKYAAFDDSAGVRISGWKTILLNADDSDGFREIAVVGNLDLISIGHSYIGTEFLQSEIEKFYVWEGELTLSQVRAESGKWVICYSKTLLSAKPDGKTDVLGNPLRYKGQVRVDGQLKDAACFKSGTAYVDYSQANKEIYSFTACQWVKFNGAAPISPFRLFNNRGTGAAGTQSGFQLSGGAGLAEWNNIWVESSDLSANVAISSATDWANSVPITEADGNWHLIIIRYDSSKGMVELISDCVVRASSTKAAMIGKSITTSRVIAFGVAANDLAHPFDGWSFGHKLFSRAIADEEVQDLYNLKDIKADIIDSPLSESKGRFISNLVEGMPHGTVIPNGAAENSWWSVQDKFHWNEVMGYNYGELKQDTKDESTNFFYRNISGGEVVVTKEGEAFIFTSVDPSQTHRYSVDFQKYIQRTGGVYKFEIDYEIVGASIPTELGVYLGNSAGQFNFGGSNLTQRSVGRFKQTGYINTNLETASQYGTQVMYINIHTGAGVGLEKFIVHSLVLYNDTAFPAVSFNKNVFGESLTHLGSRFTNKLSPLAKVQVNPNDTPVLPADSSKIIQMNETTEGWQMGDGKDIISLPKSLGSAAITLNENCFLQWTSLTNNNAFTQNATNKADNFKFKCCVVNNGFTTTTLTGHKGNRNHLLAAQLYNYGSTTRRGFDIAIQSDGKVNVMMSDYADASYIPDLDISTDSIITNGIPYWIEVDKVGVNVTVTVEGGGKKTIVKGIKNVEEIGYTTTGSYTVTKGLITVLFAEFQSYDDETHTFKSYFSEGAGSIIRGLNNNHYLTVNNLDNNITWSRKQNIFHWNKVWGENRPFLPINNITAHPIGNAAGNSESVSENVVTINAGYYSGASVQMMGLPVGYKYKMKFRVQGPSGCKYNLESGYAGSIEGGHRLGNTSTDKTYEFMILSDAEGDCGFGFKSTVADVIHTYTVTILEFEQITATPCQPKTFTDINGNPATNTEEIQTTGRELLRIDRITNQNNY